MRRCRGLSQLQCVPWRGLAESNPTSQLAAKKSSSSYYNVLRSRMEGISSMYAKKSTNLPGSKRAFSVAINDYDAQYDTISYTGKAYDDDNDDVQSGKKLNSSHRHCDTCACEDQTYIQSLDDLSKGEKDDDHNHDSDESEHVCRDLYLTTKMPLPPPLPEPKYSFHRRILPSSLIQLSSPEGKILFQESLLSGMAESFFPLSEQFMNQADPAYCGVTSLIMILNAFGIDPNVRWKGGWRWYGSEDFILEMCCIDKERVRRAGILMEEYQSLGRCQGLKVIMKRPMSPEESTTANGHNGSILNNNHLKNIKQEKHFTIDDFREDIISMVKRPPIFEREVISSTTSQTKLENKDLKTSMVDNVDDGGFIVVSFSRSSLGQTGDGHFSPIAAYHEATDKCLVLDVARFKYSPYWVSVSDLFDATLPNDVMTNKSRGWFLNFPVNANSLSMNNAKYKSVAEKRSRYKGSKTTHEAKRPVDIVPVVGDGKVSCPVDRIKVKYCMVSRN
mmetsp:Transcript_18783/g.23046  ORF Transcript_18783/g.23046 Transcript_18783/m.23046 type:complete len:504 (+) Transcript_18783:192-1703(+)